MTRRRAALLHWRSVNPHACRDSGIEDVMATTHADPLTTADCLADAVSRAAHAAHEVRLLKTMAAVIRDRNAY